MIDHRLLQRFDVVFSIFLGLWYVRHTGWSKKADTYTVSRVSAFWDHPVCIQRRIPFFI